VLLFSTTVASASITPLPLDSDVGGAHPWKKENRLREENQQYKDESIHVRVEKFRHEGLRYIVAYVDIVDPSQIRTASSYGTYDDHRYVKTQIIAKSVNSIVCVNGDFFKYNDFGYLIRQCQLLRERPSGEHDVLMIDNMGDFHVLTLPTIDDINQYIANMEEGRFVVNTFNFGPILVNDGVVLEPETKFYQSTKKQQRVAIVQRGPLSYAIIQADGKTDSTVGINLKKFAVAIKDIIPDAQIAYNLDGGGSAHVVYLDKMLNTNSSSRSICDILYFTSIADE
jgi:exopolysaccharide biosynthesis protein